MRHQVLQLRLLRGARLVCCVYLIRSILIPGQLLAEQTEEFRLFHEPLNTVETDSSSIKLNQSPVKLSDFWQPRNQQSADGSVAKASDINVPMTDKPSADKPSVDKPNDDKPNAGTELAFQYNGFITTTSGRHYLLNGVPVSGIESLVLVSVKRSGRSIVLKTPKGQLFELSVGQSINKGLL